MGFGLFFVLRIILFYFNFFKKILFFIFEILLIYFYFIYFSVQVLAMSSVLQEGEDSSVPRVPSARPWGCAGSPFAIQFINIKLNPERF